MDNEQQKQKAFAAYSRNNLEKAKRIIDKLCKRDKLDAQLWMLAGLTEGKLGNLELARTRLQNAAKLEPENSEIWQNLGFIAEQQHHSSQATDYYERALKFSPDNVPLLFRYGMALNAKHEYEKAITSYDKALQLDSSFYPLYLQKGIALSYIKGDDNNLKQAIDCFKHYQKVYDDADVNNNLGIAYQELKQFDLAETHINKAVAMAPENGFFHINLANIYVETGRYGDAIARYRQGLLFAPEHHIAHSTLLYLLNSQPDITKQQLDNEHRAWDKLHGQVGRRKLYKHKKKTVKNKIRIGYVSPDLRNHPVSYFFLPLIQHHDKEKFEIFCYSSCPPNKEDTISERLKSCSDNWQNVFSLNDAELAQTIFNDSIDVLVDLAGHTANNRLLAFTYKPAPIQVSYLGYGHSTGLTAMDYWLVDHITHPDIPVAEINSDAQSDKPYVLPRCFYAYALPEDAPDITARDDAAEIVFGSFNNFVKVSQPCIETWAAILKALPHARLLIQATQLDQEKIRLKLLNDFQQYGIEANRLRLIGTVKTANDRLALHNEVDVCLSTFPYSGATTTIESMWMGVPTVALKGESLAQQFSVTFLSAVGLADCCTETIATYIDKAVMLAQDNLRLAGLRRTLRAHVAASELGNGAQLAAEIENFYLIAHNSWLI